MDELTREQFATAVAEALSSVQHLHREVHHLMARLRDVLGQGSARLNTVTGTMPGISRDDTRMVLRHEYGLLLAPADSDEAGSEDEGEDALEETPEEEDVPRPGRRRTPPIEIEASRRLLAIRVAIHDPQSAEAFEPHVAYAVVGDWSVGGTAVGDGGRFLVARRMLRRIPRLLSTRTLSVGDRVMTSARVKSVGMSKSGRDRQLGLRLRSAVERQPLYGFDTIESLDQLAEKMKTVWSTAQ